MGFWVVIFVITLIIGIASFFSGEYGVWFGALIFWIISIIGMMANIDSSELTTTPIQSSFVSESDLQNNFLNISWREMEELTGELFRRKGYSVKVTQSSNDYGNGQMKIFYEIPTNCILCVSMNLKHMEGLKMNGRERRNRTCQDCGMIMILAD